MSNYGTGACLHVPFDLNNDVIVDDDGVSYFISNIYVSDDEEPQEFRTPLDEMVEGLCDFYGDVEGYQHLYVVAHELSRAAETLREKAGFIEDSVSAVSDLFDLGDD
tara:strand:- start:107 stop:427 length:321 start_codon:yes stop_codon:yes gene_type:complete